MNEQLWNLLITVISGVLVYVICQWYTEFILRPIQEYKELKAKVAKMLVLNAQYYSNPIVYGQGEDDLVWSKAAHEMRELAAEVAAFIEIKPAHIWVFMYIPTKRKLSEAYHYLIGLSNSFFIPKHQEVSQHERIYKYPEIIRKNMGLRNAKKAVE